MYLIGSFTMATKLSNEEVLEIIRRMKSGGFGSDLENTKKVKSITDIYPGISDLIFHHSEDLSPEKILEKAKEVRPIQL